MGRRLSTGVGPRFSIPDGSRDLPRDARHHAGRGLRVLAPVDTRGTPTSA